MGDGRGCLCTFVCKMQNYLPHEFTMTTRITSLLVGTIVSSRWDRTSPQIRQRNYVWTGDGRGCLCTFVCKMQNYLPHEFTMTTRITSLLVGTIVSSRWDRTSPQIRQRNYVWTGDGRGCLCTFVCKMQNYLPHEFTMTTRIKSLLVGTIVHPIRMYLTLFIVFTVRL